MELSLKELAAMYVHYAEIIFNALSHWIQLSSMKTFMFRWFFLNHRSEIRIISSTLSLYWIQLRTFKFHSTHSMLRSCFSFKDSMQFSRSIDFRMNLFFEENSFYPPGILDNFLRRKNIPQPLKNTSYAFTYKYPHFLLGFRYSTRDSNTPLHAVEWQTCHEVSS